MSTVYRAAIVGTGRIGSTYDDEIADPKEPEFYRGEMRHAGLYTILPINHAGAYATTPGFELVAAANRSEAKLRDFENRWGVRALYTDFRKMLRETEPEVVSVCTQSPEKAEVTVAAAEAGAKAIIVEKALATSMAEADLMIDACEKNGTFLGINHPWRFSPLGRKTKKLIEDGAIGEIGTVSTHAIGGMMHIGTHTFDMLRYWAGDVTEIEARVPDYVQEKDLPAGGILWFANGVNGFFDHVHAMTPSFEARGTTGYLTISTCVGDGWLYQIEPSFPADASRKYPNRLAVSPIEGEPHTLSPTQRLFSDLYETLANGVPFISPGRDGAAALELGLACYASHLAGGPIKLPLADRTLRVPNR